MSDSIDNPTPDITPDDEQDNAEPQRATRFDSENNPLEEAPFYCPSCGRRYNYLRECTGTATAPHAPVDVVSTDELQGDEHTAAP